MKSEQQKKKEFINSQLWWGAMMMAISFMLIIASPLIWIWYSWELASKFLYTGITGYIITSLILYFAKKIMSKAYDEFINQEKEAFEKSQYEKPVKSGFMQRLEEVQRLQQEQYKNRTK